MEITDFIHYFPDGKLLIALMIVFVLDFIFGVTKATITKVRRTSVGFRKTFTKFLQYGGSIIVAMVLLNIVSTDVKIYGKEFSFIFGDAMLYIMIYIEIVSIFENMEETSPKSDFVKFFIRPIRRILTFRLHNLLANSLEPLEKKK